MSPASTFFVPVKLADGIITLIDLGSISDAFMSAYLVPNIVPFEVDLIQILQSIIEQDQIVLTAESIVSIQDMCISIALLCGWTIAEPDSDSSFRWVLRLS